MIEIFARPLGALLKIIFNALTNVGLDFGILSAYALSIVITTIIFKLILLPLTIKQTKSMKDMQAIQPKLQEIQKKYKNDQQTLGVKQMELYKEHNINPLGGCLPLLVQMPILLAYFRVMQSPVKYVFESEKAYEMVNKSFLWVQNIAVSPGTIIGGSVNELSVAGFTLPLMAVIAALTTYFSTKMMTAAQPEQANNQAASTQKTMNLVTPFIILMFGFNYPVGLTLYWAVSNTFQMLQQFVAKKTITGVKEVK